MKQFRDTPYYVTENGEIYRLWKTGFKKMKPYVNIRGYVHINLCTNGKTQIFKIHRLVAECYLPNPNNLPLVEHKDDVKTNNNVSKLMWSTNNDNMKTAIKNNRIKKGQECYNSKLTNEQIEFIRKNYIARHPEFGTRAFGRKFNVSNSLISRIIKNKRWSHINPEQNLEY